MKKIAVLGAGMVGRVIAEDLAAAFDVTSIDRDASARDRLSERVRFQQQDLSDFAAYNALLAPFDLIVCAVPGFMGYHALEAIIRAGKSVADISFFPEDSLQLDALAKEHQVTAITDCGVAPGMSNLIFGYEDSKSPLTYLSCMVGGLPKKRLFPFEYKAPFSPVDVIEEYTRPARLKENGHVVEKPALSEPEIVETAAGSLEAFNTDGLRSLLFTMPHVRNMKEKTMRYPGHIKLIESLKTAGFFNTDQIDIKGQKISPLDVTSAILFDNWRYSQGEEDITVMEMEMCNEADPKKLICYSLYDEYDASTHTPSMSRTTGFACSAFLHLISENKFAKHGIFPPELVGKSDGAFDFVMNYLGARNVVYTKSVH